MPIKPRGLSGDPSRVLYPDPPSHDFCVWLIIAELMRRHHKAPGPLKVRLALTNGQLGMFDFGPHAFLSGNSYRCSVPPEYSDQMINHVMRPAMAMLGAVEEPLLWCHAEREADGSFAYYIPSVDLTPYTEYNYHVWQLVDAARAGHPIPRWSPPQWAQDEVSRLLGPIERPIVITLREAAHQPERNSRIGDWLIFANYIEARHPEHPVIFVRDTAKAHERLPHLTFEAASLNVSIRAALYQRALVNMMVCNGPVAWCLFSEAPYLMFKQLVPELPLWGGGTPKGWREQAHLEVGEQYPWALPTQRLTWTDDTFENIRDAFDAFLSR